jgi:hypothetical protein|tara:strand:+ start:198 stop:1181 length:984 start_codon:yes stop_codon:yes gene_type:complete
MSGLANYNRAAGSFGTNVETSKSAMTQRGNAARESYNQQVRGVQDLISFQKNKYLQDTQAAIQAKVDQGKALSESAVGGALAAKGLKSGVQIYRAGQEARAAKLTADAAKAAPKPAPVSSSSGVVDSADSKVISTTSESTDSAPESSFGSLGEQNYGSGIAAQPTEVTSGGATSGDVAESAGTDTADVAESADSAATTAQSLFTTASEGVQTATDVITGATADIAETGGMGLLEGVLTAGGVEGSVASGIVAAAPEVAGALILGGTLAYGLYDVFHHGAPNAPPPAPGLPSFNPAAAAAPVLAKARNQFVTASFDSVIDTPAASAAF